MNKPKPIEPAAAVPYRPAAMLAPQLPAMSRAGLAKQIADSIVEGIATGVFAPGDRLVEMDVCTRLDVSRIPVREALRILEAQGVAVSIPRRGYRVARLDNERVAQIHEVRVSLELIAARYAARRLAAAPELAGGLERIVAQMAQRADRNDWSGPNAIDIEFHREMCRVSGNQIVETLWEAIARHIRVVFGRSVDADNDPEFLHQEHRTLCDVLKAGDPDAVVAEVRHHLRSTHLRNDG